MSLATHAPRDAVAELVERSLREAWAFHQLPWDAPVDPERVDLGISSLLDGAGVAAFDRMTAREQNELAFAECGYHLSNLLAGERSGERVAAQVLLETRRDVEMLAVIAEEEAKHYLALERYLRDKLGRVYRPSPSLARVIAALEGPVEPEVKLLVGQVILEWTAAALLSTLVVQVREPLLREVLRLNLRDEGRHIAYGYLLAPRLRHRFRRERARRDLDDLAFEAVRASADALLATPVWRGFGVPARAARRAALERLAAMGVRERYTRLVPLQLARCGIDSATLVRRLDAELWPSLVRRG